MKGNSFNELLRWGFSTHICMSVLAREAPRRSQPRALASVPLPKPVGQAAKQGDAGQPRDHCWVTLRASTAVTPHGATASALGSCRGGDMRQSQDSTSPQYSVWNPWQIVPLEVPIWLERMSEETAEEQSSSWDGQQEWSGGIRPRAKSTTALCLPWFPWAKRAGITSLGRATSLPSPAGRKARTFPSMVRGRAPAPGLWALPLPVKLPSSDFRCWTSQKTAEASCARICILKRCHSSGNSPAVAPALQTDKSLQPLKQLNGIAQHCPPLLPLLFLFRHFSLLARLFLIFSISNYRNTLQTFLKKKTI